MRVEIIAALASLALVPSRRPWITTAFDPVGTIAPRSTLARVPRPTGVAVVGGNATR